VIDAMNAVNGTQATFVNVPNMSM